MTPMTTLPVEAPWRDMASAPKDGTRILLRREHQYERTVLIGRYDDDKYARKPRPYWATEGCLGITVDRQREPNGWMPLPNLENASAPRHPNELLEAAREAAIAMSAHVPSPVAVQHASVEWKRTYEAYHKLRTAIRNAEQTGVGKQ